MLARFVSMLAPPLCAVCGCSAAPGEPLCTRCESALRRARPQTVLVPGADGAFAAAPYDGIARQLVAALKFRGLLGVARPMAAAIAGAVSLDEDATIVPVPAAPSRRRRRGFDPGEELAEALSELAARPLLRCLRRGDGPRQVGRARRERLASPPRVWAVAPAPVRTVLVDDVVTTGATLTSCAMALRAAGALEVRAVTFARSMRPGTTEGGERADRGQGPAHGGDR